MLPTLIKLLSLWAYILRRLKRGVKVSIELRVVALGVAALNGASNPVAEKVRLELGFNQLISLLNYGFLKAPLPHVYPVLLV